MTRSNELDRAYDSGTFGISRRSFLQLAGLAGVTAWGGALVFPGSASASPAQASSWKPLPAAGDRVIRFSVHSDTHIGADYAHPEEKVKTAFKALKQIAPDLKAHFFVGDSADHGSAAEYDVLARLLNENAFAPVGILMGNHELGYYDDKSIPVLERQKNAQDEFKRFLATKLKVKGSYQIPGGANEGQLDADFRVGPYHVIGVSPHFGGFDYAWYGDRQDWMLNAIEDAAGESPDQPVFFMTHHPFPHTVWYSGDNSWDGQFDEDGDVEQSNAFLSKLEGRYPQLIHFSGHTHIPMVDPRSIYQKGFTLIQTATFGNGFWMKDDGIDDAGSSAGSPSDGSDASQCEIVEVDTVTQQVKVYRLDFRNEQPLIAEPWLIDVQAGAGAFRYREADRVAASKPPVVGKPDAVSIKETPDAPGGFTFSLDAASVEPDVTGAFDDVVLSYRAEVVDEAGGKVYEARFMSDYYKAAKNRAAVFERPLFGAQLPASQRCELHLFAQDAYGKEAKLGSVAFETGESAQGLLLDVSFANGDLRDLSKTGREPHAFGSIEPKMSALFNRKIVSFDGESAVGYDFGAADYAGLASAATLEALIRFTETPAGGAGGYFDFLSSTEAGGLGFEYYGDNTVAFDLKPVDGDYAYASAPVALNRWAHVIGTFDGGSQRLYIDGKLAKETKVAGKVSEPQGEQRRFFIGADYAGKGNPGAFFKGDIAFARVYAGALSAEDAAARYADCAAPVEAPRIPVEGAIGDVTVGEAVKLPAVSGTDLNGATLVGRPEVLDPDGQSVEVKDGAFTPLKSGDYTLFYRVGWAVTDTMTLKAQARQPSGEKPGGGNGQDAGGNGGTTEAPAGGANQSGPQAGAGRVDASNRVGGKTANAGRRASGSAGRLPQTGDAISLAGAAAGLLGLGAVLGGARLRAEGKAPEADDGVSDSAFDGSEDR